MGKRYLISFVLPYLQLHCLWKLVKMCKTFQGWTIQSEPRLSFITSHTTPLLMLKGVKARGIFTQPPVLWTRVSHRYLCDKKCGVHFIILDFVLSVSLAFEFNSLFTTIDWSLHSCRHHLSIFHSILPVLVNKKTSTWGSTSLPSWRMHFTLLMTENNARYGDIDSDCQQNHVILKKQPTPTPSVPYCAKKLFFLNQSYDQNWWKRLQTWWRTTQTSNKSDLLLAPFV